MKSKIAGIKRELEVLERRLGPLQRKQWKLYDHLQKARAAEVLETGILSTLSWRLRIYHTSAYHLEYVPDVDLQIKGKRWPDIFDEIIPYPHSHFELAKGITLNQDDGTITLYFRTVFQLRKFFRENNLKIIRWDDLKTLQRKIRASRLLLNQLEG